MLSKFKENKKVMEIKMDQARKLAEEAADEFAASIRTLVKDASEEDFKELIQAEDDMITPEDKVAVAAIFADTHDGVAVIGFGRK